MKQLLCLLSLPSWYAILPQAENSLENEPYTELSKMVNSNNSVFHVRNAITMMKSWLSHKFLKEWACYPVIQMSWWKFVADLLVRWYCYGLPLHCHWLVCAAIFLSMEEVNNERRWNCWLCLIVLSSGFQLKHNIQFTQGWEIMVLMKDLQGLTISSLNQSMVHNCFRPQFP